MGPPLFADRLDAGRRLGHTFERVPHDDAIVLGLARGGAEVGYALALHLNLPLLVLVVRKLGAPGNPELAIGAVSETGVVWIDRESCAATHASDRHVAAEISRQTVNARRRATAYVSRIPLTELQGRAVIVVDDGIATGATSLVALRTARNLGTTEVFLATPIASRQAISLLRDESDRMVALFTPLQFGAVGLFYENFNPVTDETVVQYLLHMKNRVVSSSPDHANEGP